MNNLLGLEEIAGAVARGWCHPVNENKEMDVDLAACITTEVSKLLSFSENIPRLGLASTRDLLDELSARAELGGYAGHRTVDGVLHD